MRGEDGELTLAPNLTDLNAFLAVTQSRSFRDAARKLGVSPTTLSTTVQRLETSLGVRLLHGARSDALTRAPRKSPSKAHIRILSVWN
ncbi:LysR family transcriptional regulator [Mesorhizobium sp. BH1-1-4]|uniref:helix-turn-helix domain-containing protein n=1 Tax=Mesorhizobium sp. BH1-1-4 TaxID=2876662 RepID=UPI001CD04920|nr:LysR family transcriptional regulator [Mesorhizobium sp. BH1-1-4]MBZ9993138.1 LysR family transcriptional regulator [Mesorhizobium sp. BH1-1-4]